MSAHPRNNTFQSWTIFPQASHLVAEVVADCAVRVPALAALSQRLLSECGVRLLDIIDHIGAPPSWLDASRSAGWERRADGAYRHGGGQFPDFVAAEPLTVAIRCESAEQLARACGVSAHIEGEPLAPLRTIELFSAPGARVLGVERNGGEGHVVSPQPESALRAARVALQAFRARRREFDRPQIGLAHTEHLVDHAVGELGPHWACALFLRSEREFWASQCQAGRLQQARQEVAGIGWANVDHHTYDSSREWFSATVRILERLGYVCRELFYAGHQAGWGSQILEQPALRSTIFADIDLAPDELSIDFAHMPLAPLPKHRRAGLWCAMHGESILQAGLNHVAGMYDHRALARQLDARGLRLMAPFSDMPHLYQALTEGEWRPVDPSRIDLLERTGHLSSAEAEEFRVNGAIACHLENLERNDGYKGFNQPGIDGVLEIIDPRKTMAKTPMPALAG